MAKRRTSSRRRKEVPTGVKIISVVYYIGAALALLGGLLFLTGSAIIDAGILGPAIFGFAGVFLIGLGVLDFFIARGLWKAQRWSWLAAIIISGLGLLSSVLAIAGGAVTSNIVGAAFHALIGGYLIWNKEAKSAFN